MSGSKPLSKRDLKKNAYTGVGHKLRFVDINVNSKEPTQTAQTIVAMLNTLMANVALHNRFRYRDRVRSKLLALNIAEMSNKKMNQPSRIGQCIATVKNLLNGQRPEFIALVMKYVLELF